MNSDTLTTPFSENDVINALDLDRDNIRTIDVHHDGNNGLIIELSLNLLPHLLQNIFSSP